MPNREIATLGGGCFWCLEAVYQRMRGVQSVESGYMGGHLANPSYQAVCTGQTGHVEVVQIAFDPETASFRDILEVFFSIHDPTTRDRQGNDSGPQYRSAIFYHDDAQRAAAEALIAELTACGGLARPDRHRSPPGVHLLSRRRLPSRLLPQPPARALLRLRGGPQGAQVPREIRSPAAPGGLSAHAYRHSLRYPR